MWLHHELEVPGGIPCYGTLISSMHLHSARGAQGLLPFKWYGIIPNLLDLLLLSQLVIAGWGQLQLGAALWNSSVALVQVLFCHWEMTPQTVVILCGILVIVLYLFTFGRGEWWLQDSMTSLLLYHIPHFLFSMCHCFLPLWSFIQVDKPEPLLIGLWACLFCILVTSFHVYSTISVTVFCLCDLFFKLHTCCFYVLVLGISFIYEFHI